MSIKNTYLTWLPKEVPLLAQRIGQNEPRRPALTELMELQLYKFDRNSTVFPIVMELNVAEYSFWTPPKHAFILQEFR